MLKITDFIYFVDGVCYFKERTKETHTSDRDLKRWNSRHANKPCGSKLSSSGYEQFAVHSKQYCLHKVVYAISNGFHYFDDIEKIGVIDHIDGNKSNNNISNLRLVTQAENCRNSGIRKDNSSGFNGVRFDVKTSKYKAYASYKNERFHLGTFASLDDAIKARADFNSGRFHKNHGRGGVEC